jgi:hypothetical protein
VMAMRKLGIYYKSQCNFPSHSDAENSRGRTNMKLISKYSPILLMVILLVVFVTSCAQLKEEKSVSKTNSADEFESLINETFPFIEGLLKTHGEFFPMANALDKNNKIVQIGAYDGNEKPLSQSVIDDLKSGLRDGAQKGEYKSIAIFYDVKVVNPNTNQKTDAVEVFVESDRENTAFKLFYPYSLTKEGVLTFSESWKNATVKEIFVKSKNEQ